MRIAEAGEGGDDFLVECPLAKALQATLVMPKKKESAAEGQGGSRSPKVRSQTRKKGIKLLSPNKRSRLQHSRKMRNPENISKDGDVMILG